MLERRAVGQVGGDAAESNAEANKCGSSAPTYLLFEVERESQPGHARYLRKLIEPPRTLILAIARLDTCCLLARILVLNAVASCLLGWILGRQEAFLDPLFAKNRSIAAVKLQQFCYVP